jgi:hypothetical protein
MRWGSIALFVAAPAACTAFSDAADAPPTDTATDAATDTATTADGSATDDAAFDCPAGAFCDDFERNDVLGNWFALNQNNGGGLAIDKTYSSSGTRSVHATTPSASSAHACLEKRSLAQDVVEISFDARYEAPLKSTQIVTFTFPPKTFLLLLFTDTGAHIIGEQSYPADGSTIDLFENARLRDVALGKWIHYVMRFDRAAQLATVSIDGETATPLPLQWTPALALDRVCIGISYSATTPASVWIDNVVLR